ncbi:hypothetical protein FOS14_01660 [Skermania sp. ID1734]|uniref:C39 family peptidase n=1 Tax=Skermania sp. ID1734 TaxID=2597516 RepID=UPI00117D4027|nr:C39 family peptidase [Skermania sp. ID1734]TSE02114.1 hypothetical protein FOS14_01660 [Skermania sp. ID1734]
MVAAPLSRFVRAAAGAALVGAVASAAFAGAASAETDHAPVSTVYGDPISAAQHWRLQHRDSDCAEMAVADVVGEITGRQPSEREILSVAQRLPSTVDGGPVYQDTDTATRKAGTSPKDLPELLSYYGIGATYTDRNLPGAPDSVVDLARDLEGGQKVIVGVNAEMLWHQPGNRTHADHAVVVTGIDLTRRVVYLNDSGIRTGRVEAIPMSVFVASWATSDDAAVITQ